MGNKERQGIVSEFYVTIKPDGRSGCISFVNALTIARWLQIDSIQTYLCEYNIVRSHLLLRNSIVM
jgi:hypothetical protein